jgi:putative oxidoreductase
MSLTAIALRVQNLLDASRRADWLAPLLLRIYLAPVMWMAGWNKAMSFADTVDWFGNADWGLGLPFPTLLASLAIAAELGGALSLLLGLGLRYMALPMMATMVVAIATVHWENGWLAISEGMGLFATERTMEATAALAKAKEILMEAGEYEALTRHGSLVVLNNGVEFAVTYLVMLLSLFFTGAGRWVSLDYWIRRRLDASAAARPA